MKVSINQQQLQEINSSIEELDQWWKQTTSEIYQNQRFIHSVEIDGKVYYDGYELYLFQNVNRIKELDIRTISSIESIKENEQSLDEYLNRFIPEALNLANQLFGNLTSEQYSLLVQLIEGLDWILKALQFNRLLFGNVTNLPQYLAIVEPLELFVKEIFEKVNQEDYVGVGDLVQYEIVPLLHQFQNRNKKSELL
ncbi:hypothetical protein [Paenibacillus ihumii]|uniref:hypothetical protein n=1 Tax=Paenibacillus ihumii TaxID=687436 RepID=UPI0006D7F288|nr:hypothetical protein [Paenibacillus ihumii]